MRSSPRLACCIVMLLAMGATSAQANTILIKADGTGAQPTIQAGVNAASYGDTVLLGPGTYTGAGNRDVNYNGKAITIASQGGAEVTIIDCQNLGRGFKFNSSEKQNSILSGVTITNGNAYEGGAVYAFIAKPTIIDNIIIDNVATSAGGGIFVYGALSTTSPSKIARNTVTGNVAGGIPGTPRGGGMWVSSTPIVIEDNTISDNVSGEGGGVYLTGSVNNTMRNNVITDNTATTAGGGIYIGGWGGQIEDNIIKFNDAWSLGGGMYVNSSSAVVERCVIANNDAGTLGGGVYFQSGYPILRNGTLVANTGNGAVISFGSNLTIDKTIIANHNTSAMLCFSTSNVTTSCSDIYNNTSDALCGTDGGDNFSSDPFFCPISSDYAIITGSPCTPARSPCAVLVGALPACVPSGVDERSPGAGTALYQNYPNPFNPTTTIEYNVEMQSRVSLRIYDATGRLVKTLVDEVQAPGQVSPVVWDGRSDSGHLVASGVYFYRLVAGDVATTKKMVLIK